MFYILFGSDEYTVGETVARLRQRLAAADEMAELNFTELDGRTLTVAALRATSDTLPFLSERRLVVVRGLIGRCNPKGGDRTGRRELADALIAYLPHIAATTRLVFAEGRLDRNNPVRRWAEKWLAGKPAPDELAVVREFNTPPASALPRWLAARAAAKDGAIEASAATALAEALAREGEVDLRLADAELEKLLTYADGRAVTSTDVNLLVTPVSLENIFRLVDALAVRNGPTAATLLHQFLDHGEHPLRLLALITRQFRLLAHTRAMLDAGVPTGEMNAPLGVPPFVVRKLTVQARSFPMSFLVSALRKLRDIDTDIKTGHTDAVLALDLFVASVCGTGRPR